MFAFLSLLFVLVVIFMLTTVQGSHEGFDAPSHTVQLPKVPAASPLLPEQGATATQETATLPLPDPHLLPGALPVAPYQQIAVSSPLPYQDTTLIKANRQQLVSLLEMMKSFLAFEAQELSERSDPSIQLPLGNARSDMQVLQNAVSLLNRNPGLQPNLTLTNLNEMSANLAYLQEQVRLQGAAGTLQGPVYEFTEGFEDTPSPPASVQEMKAFIDRVQVEIKRLSASGTTDPNVQARVASLTQMKNDVQQLVDQVTQGQLVASEVPITQEDLKKSFRALGKPNEPLPQLVHSMNLSPALNNLLPSNAQNDSETTKEIRSLLQTYGNQLMGASTVSTTGFPSAEDLHRVAQGSSAETHGDFITDVLAAYPIDAGRGAAHFDWKARAKEVESQIKKRGLNEKEFGVMPKNAAVSKDFSWKGYTRMICQRLQATLDPALPETCGCPPMDWKGWRISK